MSMTNFKKPMSLIRDLEKYFSIDGMDLSEDLDLNEDMMDNIVPRRPKCLETNAHTVQNSVEAATQSNELLKL